MSRSRVQQVMQRRHRARVNILSGNIPVLEKEPWDDEEGPDKAIDQIDYEYKQLLFSPAGDRVLLVTSRDLRLFTVQDGKQVWGRDIQEVIDQYEGWNPQEMTFKSLSFDQQSITAFAWTCKENGVENSEFFSHFISLDPDSGAVKAASAFSVNSADGMQPYTDRFLLCNFVDFSQQGHLVVARLSAVTSDDDFFASEPDAISDIIFVMDVRSKSLKLVLDVPDSLKCSTQGVFSWDETTLLSAGKIICVGDGSAVDVADGARMYYDERAFDRAANFVGCTVDVDGQEFAVIISTKSGKELWKSTLEGTEFVQFTAADSYAVVQQRGDYTIQIWDFQAQVQLLSTEPFGTYSPILMLDDKIILGQSETTMYEDAGRELIAISHHDSYCFMGIADAACACIKYANFGPYLSTDGCSLVSARLLPPENSGDDPQRTEINLVRLC